MSFNIKDLFYYFDWLKKQPTEIREPPSSTHKKHKSNSHFYTGRL